MLACVRVCVCARACMCARECMRGCMPAPGRLRTQESTASTVSWSSRVVLGVNVEFVVALLTDFGRRLWLWPAVYVCVCLRVFVYACTCVRV